MDINLSKPIFKRALRGPFVFLLCLTGEMAMGQFGNLPGRIMDAIDPSMTNTALHYDSQYKDISGSPYLENDMLQGTILLENDEVVEQAMIRYNIYEEALLFDMGDNQLTLLDPHLIAGFTYPRSNQEVKFVTAKLNEASGGFYEVIYEGTYSLFIQYTIKLTTKTNNAGSYGAKDMQGSAFKQSEKYLLTTEFGEVKEVKLTEKSLLSELPHKDKLEKYIKEQKLKMKNLIDVWKLMAYVDSID